MIVLLLAGYAGAQNMEVTRFRLLDTDLTANTHGTSRLDQNGETTALIRIVTLEKGFTFEGGSLGIVGTVQKTGELWLYVPRYAQKLTIKHPTFGVLRDYVYPVTIEGGRTYELLLDIGTGRYVTLNTSRGASDVEIDGQYAGKAPLQNLYLLFGRHTIKATNGRFEGTQEVFISSNEDKTETKIITIDMQDQSAHYGDVTVNVTGRADIFFNGRHVGTGTWRDQLKEGTYEVETRKADCDPVKTQFTVRPQQQNTITATPPTPHMGWLQLYTRPRNAIAIYNGTNPLDLTEAQTLPVGTYQVSISRRGYITQNLDYTVRRGETTRDTVQLERVTYIKPRAFYFGGAFTLRNLSGATGILGVTYQHHDLQASYTFGLAASNKAYWYDNSGNYQSTMTYKLNSIAIKYGYQFPLLTRMALVPQVGYSLNTLSGTVENGSQKYGDGAVVHCAILGLKWLFVPTQHVYLFVAPEYDLAISKDKDFDSVTQGADFSANTFAVSAGVLVNF